MTTDWTDGHFVGGDIALDFANTVYERLPQPGPDLLPDTASLAAWLVRAALLPARPAMRDAGVPAAAARDADAAVSDAELRLARELRGRLWAVLEAQLSGETLPGDALAGLLAAAGRGAAGDLRVDATGAVAATTTAGALAAVATHGVALALRPTGRLRACDRCGWFFLDTSRGRPRRWCSMATCGNRAKAARHRASRRPA